MGKIKKIIPAKSAHNYQLNIQRILKNALLISPHNTIKYKNLVKYSYIDFYKRIGKYAHMVDKLGSKGGSVIGIIDYDSHRYLEGYFAIPMTGNVIFTVNWRLSPQQILYTINHAEVEILIVNKDFITLLEEIKNELKTVKKYILINENRLQDFNTTINFIGEYEDLLSQELEEYDFPDLDENAIASIFYTSGTTGNPKGVYYTHRQIVIQCLMFSVNQGVLNNALKINPYDVYTPLTSMFHVHAAGVPYIATMLGLKQVYGGKFDPESFLDLFVREKVTLSQIVPTVLSMILQHPRASDVDFFGWKVIVGGSSLSDELAKEALEKGIDIVSGYGMSETGPLLALSFLDKDDIKKDINWQVLARVKSGRPAILIDMKVVDVNNNEVPKDGKTMGEVIVRGPSFTTGYYKDQEKGEELWKDGYLHTGDLAVVDFSNNVILKDRIKDVIKSGGEWISSILLENLILKNEGVLEVAVVAVPDKKWVERPYALIIPKSSYLLDSYQIKKHLQQFVDSNIINKWAIPEDIKIVDNIPKTSVGKYDKKLIKQNYLKEIIK